MLVDTDGRLVNRAGGHHQDVPLLLRLHIRNSSAAHAHRREEVYLEGFVPIVIGEILEVLYLMEAMVRYQNVERSKVIDRLPNELVGRAGLRQVELQWQTGSALVRYLLLHDPQLFGAARAERHMCPFARQRQNGGPANAPASTRHGSNLPPKSQVHGSPFLRTVASRLSSSPTTPHYHGPSTPACCRESSRALS